MEIPAKDKSSYLKGLLIIAKRDNVLTESEEAIIKDIAHRLGFSTDFYEYTLQNLLQNEYLTEEPVKFSEKELSYSFIIDGLKLAHSDNNLHDSEIIWLRQTAKENNISMEWFDNKLEEIKKKSFQFPNPEFEIFSLI